MTTSAISHSFGYGGPGIPGRLAAELAAAHRRVEALRAPALMGGPDAREALAAARRDLAALLQPPAREL